MYLKKFQMKECNYALNPIVLSFIILKDESVVSSYFQRIF